MTVPSPFDEGICVEESRIFLIKIINKFVPTNVILVIVSINCELSLYLN